MAQSGGWLDLLGSVTLLTHLWPWSQRTQPLATAVLSEPVSSLQTHREKHSFKAHLGTKIRTKASFSFHGNHLGELGCRRVR